MEGGEREEGEGAEEEEGEEKEQEGKQEGEEEIVIYRQGWERLNVELFKSKTSLTHSPLMLLSVYMIQEVYRIFDDAITNLINGEPYEKHTSILSIQTI